MKQILIPMYQHNVFQIMLFFKANGLKKVRNYW